MIAELVAVGTELLLGNTANTNAKYLSQELSALGIDVYYHIVVGDNPARLTEVIKTAASRSDIIITTGGLGPTVDDLTKETVAACFGKGLAHNEASEQMIREYFSRMGRAMTPNNLRQAMLPEDCTVFQNSWGTAPGCAFESDGKRVIMLPGPPTECLSMFKNRALPYLKELSDSVMVSRQVRIFGLGESAVEDKLHEMMENMTNPTVAPYAKEGEVMVRVTAKADSEEHARAMTEPVLKSIYEIIGEHIYGVDVESLEQTVLDSLKRSGLSLAVAESCSGGLMSKRLTDIPGASEVFRGGAVTYTNEAKINLLGVDAELIAQETAASEAVAKEMAAGVARVCGADLGIGITGVAGPSDGSYGKPLGSVFVALFSPKGSQCRSLSLGLSRDRTRIVAVNHALDMVRRYCEGL